MDSLDSLKDKNHGLAVIPEFRTPLFIRTLVPVSTVNFRGSTEHPCLSLSTACYYVACADGVTLYDNEMKFSL